VCVCVCATPLVHVCVVCACVYAESTNCVCATSLVGVRVLCVCASGGQIVSVPRRWHVCECCVCVCVGVCGRQIVCVQRHWYVCGCCVCVRGRSADCACTTPLVCQ